MCETQHNVSLAYQSVTLAHSATLSLYISLCVCAGSVRGGAPGGRRDRRQAPEALQLVSAQRDQERQESELSVQLCCGTPHSLTHLAACCWVLLMCFSCIYLHNFSRQAKRDNHAAGILYLYCLFTRPGPPASQRVLAIEWLQTGIVYTASYYY